MQLESVKGQIVLVKVYDAISHPLTNFQIRRYQNEHLLIIKEIFFWKKYSRTNLLTIRDKVYVHVTTLDEYEKAKTHCLAIPF